jgi:2-oxoglutarate ferredoxin oxidoreductase subunit alpha
LGGYTEKSDEYKEVVDRLRRKFDTAATIAPAPIVYQDDKSKANKRWAIVSIGSCDGAIREARDRLKSDNIANLDYLRIRAFPFHQDVLDFIQGYEQVLVVEQNRDAQLRQLLSVELNLDPANLLPVLSYDGMPVSSDFIVEAVSELIRQGQAA